ncbi:hypothetical protein SJDPG2_08590 [Porphyromonas gingivalis SJD2]|uniref:restriction endonuclease subunit S n=1 Tax=Porphyromonas gingivalis TaxID=837 RepID=UPI0003D1C192|nr:restriction endonuclease subunit S [Porphyromonas gingivalis]ETA26162.1 hypothetical protein SJDPG2_08590 [Porphyromonas gingivalis SJD2]OWR81668.1 hypothetical protein SJDPG5_00130 [Porphyromonas gingivalis SJD5]
MDTKKLRQKILDLAIHGKLVPQDPNDEPASVLLQRIRTEKERLIKEGKIKRSRKPAKTSDTPHYENINFALPKNWQLSTLGEVFYMHAGKNIVASEISSNADETYRYKCIGGNGLRGYVQQFNTEGSFPIIGRQGALCGNINYVEGRFYATEHAVVVDTFCKTNVKWAFYFLIKLNLNQYATATAQPGLSVNTICDVQIPLPPLTEQQRIVAEIERWFALIDTVEQGKADLQTAIKQTKSKILDLAIHGKLVPQDPNDEPASELLKRINPKAQITCDNEHNRKFPDGWAVLKVKDAFIINPRNELDDNTDVGFIPMAYINDGYSGEFKYAQKKWAEIKNGFTHFSDGDIAVAKISPCLENLKSMILKDLPNGVGAGTTELYVFRALYTSSEYSLYFFKSNIFVRKCVGTFNGVVGQQRVGKRIIEDILFPIPPSVEQERIVAKIKELFFFIDEIQESLKA